jgi:hypothetical protein
LIHQSDDIRSLLLSVQFSQCDREFSNLIAGRCCFVALDEPIQVPHVKLRSAVESDYGQFAEGNHSPDGFFGSTEVNGCGGNVE